MEKLVYEQIGSYEDACAYLGVDPTDLPQWDNPDGERIRNQVMIERIILAFNEGRLVEPDDTVHYPVFYFYTEEEVAEMTDDDKAELYPCSGLGASAGSGSYAGLACLHAHYRVSFANAGWGFRLCFLDREACKAFSANRTFMQMLVNVNSRNRNAILS